MYIPKEFAITDWQKCRKVIDGFPLAILISQEGAISHLPFIVSQNDLGKPQLIAHCARENPHWQVLEKNSSCLAVFIGPQKYIPATWYKNPNNVSTWNYVTVHVHGKADIFHEVKDKLEILKTLTSVLDKTSTPKLVPSDNKKLLDSFLPLIVGIKIEITKFECVFKLSQNRAAEDLHAVLEKLQSSTDTRDLEMAQWMLKQSSS